MASALKYSPKIVYEQRKFMTIMRSILQGSTVTILIAYIIMMRVHQNYQNDMLWEISSEEGEGKNAQYKSEHLGQLKMEITVLQNHKK